MLFNLFTQDQTENQLCMYAMMLFFVCFRYAQSSSAFSSGILFVRLFFGQWSDEDSTYGLVSLGTVPLRYRLSEWPSKLHQVQRPHLSLNWQQLSCPLIRSLISFLSLQWEIIHGNGWQVVWGRLERAGLRLRKHRWLLVLNAERRTGSTSGWPQEVLISSNSLLAENEMRSSSSDDIVWPVGFRVASLSWRVTFMTAV